MKVKDLIKELKEIPGDYEVVMSSDGEGNAFSPLSSIGTYMYVAESTWSGELRSEEDAEANDEKYTENSVCLWPTN